MPATHTLGKKERLKSRKQIDQLFRQGKTFSSPPFRVHYTFAKRIEANTSLVKPATTSLLQFGAGVPTRNFKRATDRNRIKRLTREAWRLQNSTLKALVHEQQTQLSVFFIYTGRELPAYTDISNRTYTIIQKLIQLLTGK